MILYWGVAHEDHVTLGKAIVLEILPTGRLFSDASTTLQEQLNRSVSTCYAVVAPPFITVRLIARIHVAMLSCSLYTGGIGT